MNENNKDFEKEYDSFKDVAEFQNNMFNPGHYIGTGKVPPTVSAPGNAAPIAVFCFITSAGIIAFGLWLLAPIFETILVFSRKTKYIGFEEENEE